DTLFAMRLVVSLLAFLLLGLSFIKFGSVDAQITRPILISHADSTRAISFESVTRRREPFNTTVEVRFGPDSATRIMLFAMNLQLQEDETAGAVTADAEDATHTLYSLIVEHVDSVPDQPWASSIVIRLPPDLPQAGDVLVRIKYRGME